MSVSDHLEEALDLSDELLLAETAEEVATIAVALRVHLLRARDDLSVGVLDDGGTSYPTFTPNVAQTATQGPLRASPTKDELVRERITKPLPDVAPPTKVYAQDVTCPTCAAKPNKPCVATKNNAGGKDIAKGTPITAYHKARRDRAKEKNES